MSQFTDFIQVTIPNKKSKYFTLVEPLVYEVGYKGSDIKIVIPQGFETDFASTYVVGLFFKPYDRRWILASILHDYLFSKAKTLREYQDANDLFYEAMQVTGTQKSIAIIFYLAVSITKYFYLGYALASRSQTEKDK